MDGRGACELEHGNLSRARNLASFVLSIDAGCDDARALRETVEGTTRAGSRGGSRAWACGAGHRRRRGRRGGRPRSRARGPRQSGGRRLRHEAERLLAEQRRLAEHERRARAAVLEARRRFASDPAAAVALLQTFAPPHAEVTQVLQELRALASRNRARSQGRTGAAEGRTGRESTGGRRSQTAGGGASRRRSQTAGGSAAPGRGATPRRGATPGGSAATGGSQAH